MTHLKSLAAPRHFPKKETVFTVSPRSGKHPKERSIPLLIVVRDILGYAEDRATAQKLIKSGKFQVDGKTVRDPRFSLGLMDVFRAPEIGESYRVVIRPLKGLSLQTVGEDEVGFKVCQVVRKNHVRAGDLALGLHDGRTILFKGDDVKTGRSYKIFDSVKITVPEQEILESVSLENGCYGYIVKGSRAGLHGQVIRIRRDVVFPDKPTATIATSQGTVTTLLRNIMPVGVGKPWITLP
ncbi:MAG: S4 domain-containing protein [Candidatus Caldarchaeum sp.]|nr:S4 domain-containing protein [Candidatus Caldarchaeum sp.]MDW7978035.1 S4 domain-containing protein [Candidatus Caldarchaeum sp.]MDW8360441.1 S4 domain-containing protein [Candidatus Caldarchaeum sp.]